MTQTESGGVIDSKPGSESGALISATSPGSPAALTSFGARPKRAPPASCSASLVELGGGQRRRQQRGLEAVGHRALGDDGGESADSAASVIACPPPNEEPNSPTRSIPGSAARVVDRGPPVRELAADVEQLARLAAAGAEMAVVEHERGQAGRGEALGVGGQALVVHGGEAVAEHDARRSPPRDARARRRRRRAVSERKPLCGEHFPEPAGVIRHERAGRARPAGRASMCSRSWSKVIISRTDGAIWKSAAFGRSPPITPSASSASTRSSWPGSASRHVRAVSSLGAHLQQHDGLDRGQHARIVFAGTLSTGAVRKLAIASGSWPTL